MSESANRLEARFLIKLTKSGGDDTGSSSGISSLVLHGEHIPIEFTVDALPLLACWSLVVGRLKFQTVRTRIIMRHNSRPDCEKLELCLFGQTVRRYFPFHRIRVGANRTKARDKLSRVSGGETITGRT